MISKLSNYFAKNTPIYDILLDNQERILTLLPPIGAAPAVLNGV